MALYYDAVTVLTSAAEQGSLKSRIYGGKIGLKSKPAQVYALITECAKYDSVLKEVIENAALLEQEPKLSPVLSLLLVHDHFFSEGGIATSSTHPLKLSIDRHKARLQAEFTKARLRRKCATVEALKKHLETEKTGNQSSREQPRWARINRLITSTESLLEESFNGYVPASDLSEVIQADHSTRVFWCDRNVPDLLAFSPGAELTKTNAYARDEIILQDKASCFPGYLLLGEAQPRTKPIDRSVMGDILDACAAPGNKTTHLAAIVKFLQEKSARSGNTLKHKSKIFACERDPSRSKVLQSMVDKSGATDVKVLARQDFFALDPSDAKFANVTHLLLDPSCSGSGIVGREDIPVLALPKEAPRADQKSQARNHRDGKGKKRKREEVVSAEDLLSSSQNVEVEEIGHQKIDESRLERLSNVQSRIVEHAFAFPAAVRVTYSTCSVHVDENESVVSRVLQSSVGKSRGWKLLSRQDQPKGLQEWTRRGIQDSKQKEREAKRMADDELDACIRCYPGDDEGTMGFFVCCFVRSPLEFGGTKRQASLPHEADDEEEWDGLSD